MVRQVSKPPQALTLPEFEERLSGHVYTLYMNYSFLIKGGVYTVAALALLHIMQQPSDFRFGRLLFWAVSFMFSLVTIATWSRGSALANSKAGVLDVILPIGIAIPEYLAFIVVDPTAAGSLPWYYWYLFLAAHAALGFAIVTYRLSLTDPQSDFDDQLKPLAEDYMDWMKGDQRGAAIGVALNLILFLSTLLSPWLASPAANWVHYIAGTFLFFVGAQITYNAYRQYDAMTTYEPPRNAAAA
jgi:hypothetical protein